MDKAVILLSGGQDSSTCLFWAKAEGYQCYALGFNYGQRHIGELGQANKIAVMAAMPFDVFPLQCFKQIADSDLIKPKGEFTEREDGLPSSFVPGRNIMFLSCAAAYAKKVGATTIVAGFSQEDYSGYPDCRSEFVHQMESALRYGLDMPELTIIAPLMFKNKAETFALAEGLGVLPEIVRDTRTCYNGDPQMHEWGRGCGKCPACELRKKGFQQFMKARV